MPETEKLEPCAVCGELDKEKLGRVGFDGMPPEAEIVACRECYKDGGDDTKFAKWFLKALDSIRSAEVAFISSGNVAKDLRTLEDYRKHDSRIKDGICPNGCAQMVRQYPDSAHYAKCPTCNFQHYSNVPMEFPFEVEAGKS